MTKRTDADILKYIQAYADRSHGEQVRKYSGDRYIVHPVRVMRMVREFNDDVTILAAALLHDVLEDTPVTAADMHNALLHVMSPLQAEKTVQLVIELTDIFIKSSYPGLNRRRRKEREVQRLSTISGEAQTIKYADIIDNVTDIVREDTDFAKVYIHEARNMLAVMRAGHPELRTKALEVVEQSRPHIFTPGESKIG